MADFSRRDVPWLERRRAELFTLISQAGDFRRGSVNAVWRKCGKPNCACAQPGHRGHGPQWNLTRRIGGKTVNVYLKPGPGTGWQHRNPDPSHGKVIVASNPNRRYRTKRAGVGCRDFVRISCF